MSDHDAVDLLGQRLDPLLERIALVGEGKVGAMIYSVLNCQEAYAKALCVPRQKLADAQAASEVLLAHQIITDAFRTDVRPLLAQVREELGVPVDPITAHRASGYDAKVAKDRGVSQSSGGYQ